MASPLVSIIITNYNYARWVIEAVDTSHGMTRGEILKLRWDQVDWNENLIRLEKRQTKAKKARIAPLYGELRAWLDMAYAARDPECPYIISWRGHGVSAAVGDHFRRFIENRFA